MGGDGGAASGARAQGVGLWSDCADAYVLLAQAALNLEQARELLERGVTAGERAIGLKEDVGHFWLILETRPYMRARAALAEVLSRLGRREQAIDHQRELLCLNPNDNQGLRYRQTQWLLTLERYEELDALFAAYEDDAAASFAYTRALAAFRRDSDTAATRTLLGQARERNAHVPRSQGGPRRPGDAGTDRAPIRMHPSRTMTAGGKLSRAAAAVLRA